LPGLAIGQHDDTLDGREAPGRVVGEVGVHLRRDVEAPEREPGRLDVKAAARRVERQHSRPERLALGLQREGVLDGRDALVERQQGRHVAPGQEQRHRVSTRRMVAKSIRS
jgi:hypothetical protein